MSIHCHTHSTPTLIIRRQRFVAARRILASLIRATLGDLATI